MSPDELLCIITGEDQMGLAILSLAMAGPDGPDRGPLFDWDALTRRACKMTFEGQPALTANSWN